MKKLLLGIVLVLLIIGVSYVKSVREEGRREKIADDIKAATAAKTTELEQSVDSLQAEIDRTGQQYADSLDAVDRYYGEEIDSLHATLAGRDADIDSLRKLAAKPVPSVKPAAKSTATAKKDTHNTLEFHRKVLAYYKKRYDDLPSDLTAYEQKVALAEIRTETAQRFAITVSKLNRIREENHIDY